MDIMHVEWERFYGLEFLFLFFIFAFFTPTIDSALMSEFRGASGAKEKEA